MEIEKSSVAILGMGFSLAYYFADLPAYATRFTDQVWAINNAGYWIHDIDTIISMDDLERDHTHWTDHVLNMLKRDLPIMTCTAYDKWPQSVAFPIDEYRKEFGQPSEGKKLWFDNSIAYAIALAMLQKHTDIHLYGCDFQRTDSLTAGELERRMAKYPDSVPWWFIYHHRDTVRERRSGEPGIENVMYLIGRARERGIRIHIPRGSTLMDMDRQEHLYGFQEQPYDKDGNKIGWEK